ncbi:hypothetical protein Taro_033619 [Colocasia esculenta]|uniref:Pentatricopeptide repeat-containing protein n=1 Tax=Colocasia esculenta TaxID=4460 RepID=A0A843W595_COLES|nr:hypothetical protein [Colocasia esculenta]
MDPQRLRSLLRACAASNSQKQGLLLHQKAVALGLHHDPVVCRSLVTFYLSCNLLEPARVVFDHADDDPSDISLWNALLAAYAKNRLLHRDAVLLFNRLRMSPHLRPDSYTYPSVLKAYAGLGGGKEGGKMHAQVVKSGCGADVVVASSLVGMYAKCNLFGSAIRLFEEMPDRDVASWNNVLSCYYQDGQPAKALEVFERMRSSGFEPDSVTFTTVFSACARLAAVDFGKKVHEDLVRSGLQLDGYVSSALVDMYGKCGCPDSAREIFEQIRAKSVVSWNSMIGAYALTGDSKQCLELFVRMNREGVEPTETTLSSLLIACSRSSNIQQGKFIHGYILRRKIKADTFIQASLIDLYFKCGSVGCAESVFESAQDKSVVLWNVLISGYVMVGDYFKALKTFENMRVLWVRPDAVTFTIVLSACSQLGALEQGKEVHSCIIESRLDSNEIVMSALLDMYAKCGAVDEARKVFDRLPVKDLVSRTSMITAYGSHGQPREALKLFREMQSLKERPDSVSFLALLSACSHGGLVDEGCSFFNEMKSKYGIEPALEHYSCLIDLLGRSGRLREAYIILQDIPSMKRDVGVLGSLFSACCLHKNLELGEEVARLLIEMDPDDHSSYIVLSNMYASAGRWDEVRRIRGRIKNRKLKKNPGCSWIEIEKLIHQFFVEDSSHPMSETIYECLDNLVSHMESKKPLFEEWMVLD